MKEMLLSLGFSEKEANVYLTLLKMGPSAVSTIARLTGIKRTSIYDVLNPLIEKNLVVSFKQGSYTYFVVDDVNKIYLYEKEKADSAKMLVEKLNQLKHLNAGFQFNYYKGTEAYREMYEDILKSHPKEVLVWMHLDFFLKSIDPKREELWTKERIQKKIFARLLIQRTKSAKALKKRDHFSCRETRFLPKNFPFDTTCILYSGKINLFDSTGEVIGLRIINPALYQMFTSLFELSWSQGD